MFFFLRGLIFDPEGGERFLLNVDLSPKYTEVTSQKIKCSDNSLELDGTV
jgi:hypothetical protein